MSQTATLFKIVTGPAHRRTIVIPVSDTQDEIDIASKLPSVLEGHYVTLQNDGSEKVYYIWAPDDDVEIDEAADIDTDPEEQCWSIGAGESESHVPPANNYWLIVKTASSSSVLRVTVSSEYRS